MDYEEAQAIGDVGEELVSGELAELSSRYQLCWLHGVLLAPGKKTAQLDHVVVDRQGVLVVETKVRQAALIRGKESEWQWTACYPGGRNEKFQNPLRQNDGHVKLLRRALRFRYPGSPLDCFSSAVVFIGADISLLELPTRAAEVVTFEQLSRLMADRHARGLSTSHLAPEEIDAVARTIAAVDYSSQPDVVERHGARLSRNRAGTGRKLRRADLLPAPEPPWSRPVMSGDELAGILRLLLAAALVVGVFFGSGLFRLLGTLAGMGTPTTAPAGPGRPSDSSAPSAVDIQMAKRLLKESAPEIYAKVANLDSPTIGSARGITTYTWRYVVRLATDKVQVKSLTLAISGDGVVRGVNVR